VFVGIARTSDVRSYLRGTAHATVTDAQTDPFRATYRTSRGHRAAGPEAHLGRVRLGRRRARARLEGAGRRVVGRGHERHGSAGVDASARAGASVPFLDELGWSALGGGALLLLAAGALTAAGLRIRP
jgi:hypothetical protein